MIECLQHDTGLTDKYNISQLPYTDKKETEAISVGSVFLNCRSLKQLFP